MTKARIACRAVIGDRMVRFAANTARDPDAFQWPDNHETLSFPWGSRPYVILDSLGPHESASNVYAGLTNVTNRHTDRPRYSDCSNSPCLTIVVMRPDTLAVVF